ncbi:MAG: TatD family hydrolase [Alphaproteobacteria bacterium]|nr:TatD family hydrolase [Alphaproteobacteria bacterium]
MIIDSHCHLTFGDYEDDMDLVIQNAREKGVGMILNVATNKDEYAQMVGLLEKYPFIYGAFGIHPDSIEPNNMIKIDELLDLLHHLKIIGVGETGLDYHYETIDRKYQQESLMIHIEAARQTGLPLIIHTRDADDDMAAILQEAMIYHPFKAMLHCFSSSEKLAKKALDLGCYLSISGMVTFKKADDLRQIIKKIPLNRLLVETDAPFLAPVPYRGQRNEPAYIVETFKMLSELKDVPQKKLEEALESNFYTLFDKLKKENEEWK